MTTEAQALIKYIDASPSPYHCVQESARQLLEAGFTELDERSEWPELQPGDGHFMRRNGTIIGWRNGQKRPGEAGFRIVGAHTDSPNLRLKPEAQYVKDGLVQWGIQTYGGLLTYTWFDRDLGLSGRVIARGPDGLESRLIRIDRPIARVPSLAIHFNREVVTDGFKPNAQKHLPPLVALAHGANGRLESLIAQTIGVPEDDILGFDLMLHDIQQSVLGGLDEEFVFAPRLDNQASCFSALSALLSSAPADATALIALFDHEECGSQSAHGGDGAVFEHTLRRIVRDHAHARSVGSAGESDDFERSMAASLMVSADMAHGLHPNYSEYHDGHHKPMLGSGPVIKSHVNQRYATDGETSAWFRDACAAVDVPVQTFVIRTDLRCGSTIGPITSSNLGIRTVDVGCAMLSMHSIREQAASSDIGQMNAVLTHILSGA